ncbi:MAG TPA: hypothetical protein PLL10_08660, partial [Elusimicrobiales bacterium]|nr:hypothetical protein [Elusimicrobiales bacterium]
MSLLSVFISVPFVGALILLALNDSNTGRVARIAAMFSGAAFLISLLALLPDTRLLAANSAPAGAAQLLFRTAALSAPAFTASQLACLGCLCAPLPFGAAARPNRYYALLLAAQAALGAIFCTTNWLILLSLWAASALACYFLLRETRAASSIFG